MLGERQDIAELTAGLDIACSTSWGKSFANSIGEAIACGVPCVVTDVGDSRSIVGTTGKVVAAGDAAGFATALAELLHSSQDERDKMSLEARQRILEHF